MHSPEIFSNTGQSGQKTPKRWQKYQCQNWLSKLFCSRRTEDTSQKWGQSVVEPRVQQRCNPKGRTWRRHCINACIACSGVKTKQKTAEKGKHDRYRTESQLTFVEFLGWRHRFGVRIDHIGVDDRLSSRFAHGKTGKSEQQQQFHCEWLSFDCFLLL